MTRLTTGAIVLGVAAFVTTIPAHAVRARRQGAIVFHAGSTECDMLDASGNNIEGIATHSVTTTQNSNLVCRTNVSNDTGTSVTWDFANTGLPCAVYGAPYTGDQVDTNDWSETISTGGRATLTCHLH